MIVTDVEWVDRFGKKRKGYYMDGYEFMNLQGIPKKLLANHYDCVGIVSGKGKVRVGKSTKGIQAAYLLSWLLAGGEMLYEQDPHTGNVKVTGIIPPKKPVRFSLAENMVFSAEDLQDTAKKLFEKYGKQQVIVYDEGRQGLDSARAMESVNKGMEDFFQECGFMEHIIIIILPNFFKLHEDYAVSRSVFLIDCYTRNYKRGYFNFYNEYAKEKLFYFGKKMIGVTAKYSMATPNFRGRFGEFLPFDKNEYEEMKKRALAKKKRRKDEVKFKKQRDACIYLLKRYSEMTYEDLAKEISAISNSPFSARIVQRAIANITKHDSDVEEG